jgi:hypothetical protein
MAVTAMEWVRANKSHRPVLFDDDGDHAPFFWMAGLLFTQRKINNNLSL